LNTAAARKLVGKRIEWIGHWCPYRQCGIRRTGTVLEVRSRNVLIDQHGTTDWMWLPEMREIRVLKGEDHG
jgi:hypothetical protein